jgi:hypothetical protein
MARANKPEHPSHRGFFNPRKTEKSTVRSSSLDYGGRDFNGDLHVSKGNMSIATSAVLYCTSSVQHKLAACLGAVIGITTGSEIILSADPSSPSNPQSPPHTKPCSSQAFPFNPRHWALGIGH